MFHTCARTLRRPRWLGTCTRRCRTAEAMLLVCAVLLSGSTLVQAGGIAGIVRDATTNAPLGGIDLDLYDENFDAVLVEDDVTLGDGSYLLSPLPAGEYYLRADPNVLQGYVDQYYPGVFLRSEAATITVGQFGTVVVNFYLDPGAAITGTMVDESSGLPVPDIDIDVYAWDRSYITSVDAFTQADGTYRVGCFPEDTFYVRADPTDAQMYIDSYYDDRPTLELADPVQVEGLADVTGIDFSLVLGGAIGGTVTSAEGGEPLPYIDIDLFDAYGDYIPWVNADTDAEGAYVIGGMTPGTYYVKADPSTSQGYVPYFHPGVFDIGDATPVVTTGGALTSGIDIALPLGGTIDGTVTSSVTDEPIPDLRVAVFDSSGTIIHDAGDFTNSDGHFFAGAMLPGTYYLRCAGAPDLGLAFEFYSDVHLLSAATPIEVVAEENVEGIDFALDPGGWITGTVRGDDSGEPLEGVDMDVLSTSGEWIGALDAETDATGSYILGPAPPGTFVVRAEPYQHFYLIQYYDHSDSLAGATPVPVGVGATTRWIDFDLVSSMVGVDEGPLAGLASGAIRNTPNPFNPSTRIVYALPSAGHVSVRIFDVSGRLVRTLVDEFGGAGTHEVVWNGRDDRGALVASGVYFCRLEAAGTEDAIRMVLLK